MLLVDQDGRFVVPCIACWRRGQLRKMGGTHIRLCNFHAPGTPGGRRLQRMIKHFGSSSELHNQVMSEMSLIRQQERQGLITDAEVNVAIQALDELPTVGWTQLMWENSSFSAALPLRIMAWNRIEEKYVKACHERRAVGAHKRAKYGVSNAKHGAKGATFGKLGKTHGVKGGRPKNNDIYQVTKALELIKQGETQQRAAESVGMSQSTLCRRLKSL